MKKTLALALLGVLTASGANADVLRYNQVGYLTDDVKAAVYLGDTPVEQIDFKQSRFLKLNYHPR